MLQGLTRRVKGWLQGAAPEAAAVAAGAPSGDTPPEAIRLHEAALAALHEGRAPAALDAATGAISIAPQYAEAHNAAGLALRALGRLEEAAERFRRAADVRPDHVPALSNHGITCLDLGRFEDAEDSFKLALVLDPGSADTCLHLAMACWNQRRVEEAVAHFRRAIELAPRRSDAHIGLCGLLQVEGRLEQAAEGYRAALAAGLEVPELHLNCGLALFKLHRLDEAIAHFKGALAMRPEFPEAYFNLGNAYGEQEKHGEALACYRRAIELKPDYADACTNMGSLFREQGEIAEALECYRKAVALDPGSVEARHNLGVLLGFMGRMQEALACYEEAQRISPDHPQSQLNLGITQLATGDLGRGWHNYEARFRQTGADNRAVPREYPFPRWEGQSLAGKRVLVWGEQGIGDEITFSCMYQEVVAAARRCVIECAPKLVPLFARSFPAALVVGKSSPPHPATRQELDYHSPAGSLGRWLRPAVEAFPARGAHLVAAPARVAHWTGRLARLGAGLKAGFSWRSVNVKGERARACTTLDEWGALFRIPGVHWVSLQYDECSAELANARERFGVSLHAFPEVDLFNDLDEAAALTGALDLVVSAPTAVSLLAAALGVPTWQMSCPPELQMHGTGRNVWYPAMTSFVRPWDAPWDGVIAAVAAKLAQVADRGAVQPAPEAQAPLSGAAEASAQEPGFQALLAQGDRALGEDRLVDAAAAYERAAGLPGTDVTARLRLGIVRLRQGLPEQAQAAFTRVLEEQPGSIPARANRALARYEAGDLDAAVRENDAVLQEQPGHPEAHYNLALALLARGEFARGWLEYEWRFEQAALEERAANFPFPRWNGENLAGKTLLVWKEQSVGAQIMFAGMFPDLRARAGYCIVECTPKLVPLLARSFPDWDIVPRTAPPHPYTQHGIDFQVPAGSLARWLRGSPRAFPPHRGYLRADPGRVAHWRERLRALGPGPKIGFSWRSINTRGERGLACTTLDQWAAVLGIGGAHFICLQYDECGAEFAAARARFESLHRFEELDLFNDLDDAAALTCALDLVISAPTAVTDLSGALGVATWQLTYGSDWKVHGAPSNPWYPSMQRFLRGLHQPWEPVLDEVAVKLREWLRARET